MVYWRCILLFTSLHISSGITNLLRREGIDNFTSPATAIPYKTLLSPSTMIDAILEEQANLAGKTHEELYADQKLTNSMFRLPLQVPCNILIGHTMGASDYGTKSHTCNSCTSGCTERNQQLPIRMGYEIVPALSTAPAYDLKMIIEIQSVDQVKPYFSNGVHHRMQFTIQSDKHAAGDFEGEMGPKIEGGEQAADMLNGLHTFAIMDTEYPATDGKTYFHGRWLAMPGKHDPGNIGTCRRHCIKCDEVSPQLLTPGYSTGTICTANVKMDSNSKYVYRLVQRGYRKVEYDGADYWGVEWEVRIGEPISNSVYVLGTIVTEGASNKSGVTAFFTSHEHLGCSPCDAYYQSVRATGPFIETPRGVHSLIKAIDETPMRTEEEDCDMKRLIGLGGSTVLYESGPGVKEAWKTRPVDAEMVVFHCPITTSEGNVTDPPSPGPC